MSGTGSSLAAYFIAQMRADLEANLCPHGVEPASCVEHRATESGDE